MHTICRLQHHREELIKCRVKGQQWKMSLLSSSPPRFKKTFFFPPQLFSFGPFHWTLLPGFCATWISQDATKTPGGLGSMQISLHYVKRTLSATSQMPSIGLKSGDCAVNTEAIVLFKTCAAVSCWEQPLADGHCVVVKTMNM